MFTLALNLCFISRENFMVSCFLLRGESHLCNTFRLPASSSAFSVDVKPAQQLAIRPFSIIIWRIYDDAPDECFPSPHFNIYSFASFMVSGATFDPVLFLLPRQHRSGLHTDLWNHRAWGKRKVNRLKHSNLQHFTFHISPLPFLIHFNFPNAEAAADALAGARAKHQRGWECEPLRS